METFPFSMGDCLVQWLIPWSSSVQLLDHGLLVCTLCTARRDSATVGTSNRVICFLQIEIGTCDYKSLTAGRELPVAS